MTILKNKGRPVGTKFPFLFLISLKKSKSNQFPEEIG